MLEIRKTHQTANWYITLDGETIKGGMYSKEEALSYYKSFKEIWDSGYRFGKSEEKEDD